MTFRAGLAGLVLLGAALGPKAYAAEAPKTPVLEQQEKSSKKELETLLEQFKQGRLKLLYLEEKLEETKSRLYKETPADLTIQLDYLDSLKRNLDECKAQLPIYETTRKTLAEMLNKVKKGKKIFGLHSRLASIRRTKINKLTNEYMQFRKQELFDDIKEISEAGKKKTIRKPATPKKVEEKPEIPKIEEKDQYKLIFASNRSEDKTYDLYIIDLDGANEKRLALKPKENQVRFSRTLPLPTSINFPKVSPSGKYITFVYQNRIWEIDTTKKASVQWMDKVDCLTPQPSLETIKHGREVLQDLVGCCDPAWSPDEEKVVFSMVTSTSRRHNYKIISATNFEICVVNRRLKKLYSAQKATVRLTHNFVDDRYASLSLDSKKMVFASKREGNFEIIKKTGRKEKRLTRNTANDICPVYSPDGTQILFVSDRDRNKNIFIMNEDGTNQVGLTKNQSSNIAPVWSPDGKQISYASYRDKNWEIYTMNPDGSNKKRVTDNLASDVYPSWILSEQALKIPTD